MSKTMPIGLLLGIVFSFKSNAQNLIPNPSFDLTDPCNVILQAYMAEPWFQPLYSSSLGASVDQASSTDLFNSCEPTGNAFDSPNNNAGVQSPRTGDGYCGFGFYTGTIANGAREYVETGLLRPLKKNKKYCIEFYVSLAEISRFGISDISAYFSTDSLLFDSIALPPLLVSPQFTNTSTNIVIDKVNWSLISGNFIANGGEKFITIGNFKTDANTNFLNVGGAQSLSYYYIDDVSLVCCDCEPEVPNIFSPNGDGINDLLEIQNMSEEATIKIYDRWGVKVFESNKQGSLWDGRTTSGITCNEGVYYYIISTPDDNYRGCIQLVK